MTKKDFMWNDLKTKVINALAEHNIEDNTFNQTDLDLVLKWMNEIEQKYREQDS